ncbi:ASCH domain-containing protein [Schlesneria sp.]|uniref:ASCH domain-containing protein n=1 Tax=Schlesneria sp. TaxID=2762018 RepID=UPI002F13F0C8
MRNISCALTRPQIDDGTKTETRRLGWRFVEAGMCLQFVNKCMGFKRGEKPVKIRQVKVIETRREPLNAIDQEAVIREGFPDLSPAQFVEMFCKNMRCKPTDEVTVIRFRYLD